MSEKEVCNDIRTKVIIAMVICIIGTISIFVMLGLAMLKTIVLPGYSGLFLIMLATALFACVPSISIYGTYKYAECLIDDLMREITKWLQANATDYVYKTHCKKQCKEGEVK